MGQVVSLPRTISFTRQFEQLALFSEKTASGDLFFAGLLDGTVEISFDSTGDWWISDIHIDVENGLRGAAYKTKSVQINGDDHPAFYSQILDIFTDKYANTIQQWICEKAIECGLQIAA